MNRTRVRIMLVDDNKATLVMGKSILEPYYEVYPMPSAVKMFEFLEKNVVPSLILLDVEMPEMDGYAAMARLKSRKDWEEIPVIFLTAYNDEDSEMRGLNLGAQDYITKPFSSPCLRKRIDNHLQLAAQRAELKAFNNNLQDLVRRKIDEVVELQNAIISTIVDLVECRDSLTGGHIVRTRRYMELFLQAIMEKNIYMNEISQWDLNFLLPSTQLHDVGKIAISDQILKKQGVLSPVEAAEMERHTVVGMEILDRIENNTLHSAFLQHAKVIALSHHERWDGEGYPGKLRGMEIPLEGRIMAIVDSYDELLAPPAGVTPLSPEKTKQQILSGRGSCFDPVLVDVFLAVSDDFAKIAANYK